MPHIQAQFGELNTELPPHRLASGTADSALNVTIRNGKLAKRAGFAKTTPTGYASVVRCAQGPDGALYTQSTAGWFYQWAGRIYFNDITSSRFSTSGDFATTLKAGLPRPSGNPTTVVGSAVVGAKEGEYRCHYSYYNSVTGEESAISLPKKSWEPEESRASDGDGVITVGGFATGPKTTHSFDSYRIYCTNGDTERVFEPQVSFEAYLEASIAYAATSWNLPAGDSMHESVSRPHFSNNGGEPVGCAVGVFDGNQAVYAFSNTDIDFSLPGKPTMIPRLETYTDSDTGWSYTLDVEPRPWRGQLLRAMPAAPVVAAYGGGRIIISTARQTVELVKVGDGRFRPRLLCPQRGCPAAQGAVGTTQGIHVLSQDQWMIVRPSSVDNASHEHWTPTLAALGTPADAVVAHYSYDRQIWLADGNDIYIIDERTGWLISKWTIAGGGTIQAMCELTTAGSRPVMKVFSTTGLWTYDPSAWNTQYDDGGTDFAAHWQGYFGTERLVYDNIIDSLEVTLDNNTSIAGADGEVKIEVGGMGTDRTVTMGSELITGSVHRKLAHEFDRDIRGNFFKVKISTTAAQARSWSVRNLLLRYKSDT